MTAEPLGTALLLTTLGALLAIAIILSRASARIGLPVALLFLTLGVAAGTTRITGIDFTNSQYAFRLGTAALALILFDGGLNTPIAALRRYAVPAATLATLGVAGTAILVAWAAHLLGFPWTTALLLGAVVSPTDAATVFAVLRSSGINLKRRVGLTLEAESGMNDPVAVILTVVVTGNLAAGGHTLGWWVVGVVATEIVLGAIGGIAVGYGARALIKRVRLPAAGLYPVLSVAIAFLAYGLPTLVHGSGFLAVYIAGLIFGGGTIPYRMSVLRVHDAAAWLSQIAMFLVLGLLVTPAELARAAPAGLALAFILAFLARPLVVALLLAPFRYTARDIAYVGWVGLRGAVPVILALYPVLAGVAGASVVFHLVFFIVAMNAILPGLTVPWVTRRLRLEAADPPSAPAVLEIESLKPLREQLQSFHVDDALAVAGSSVADLPLPEGAAAILIIRGDTLVPPGPHVTLEPGDHVYLISRREDSALIQLMFGRPEE